MKQLIYFIGITCISITSYSQKTEYSEDVKFDKKKFLKELSENACKCIDSISTYNKIKDSVSSDINKCIDKQVGPYQLGTKLAEINDFKKNTEDVKDKKHINISINVNPDSKEYKEYYYEMERYLVNNCAAIKSKITVNDKVNNKSFSNNDEALKYYSLGLDESKKENYQKAIDYYKKALVFDPILLLLMII